MPQAPASSFPIRVEIPCLMKNAAPRTGPSNVLDQRWTMVEHGVFESPGQSGDFDVLHSFNLLPMSHDVPHRRQGKQERLASEDGMRRDDHGLIAQIASRLAEIGIIQAGQRDVSVSERSPSLEIMAEMPVEYQVVFEEQDVIGRGAQTPLKGAQRGFRLAVPVILA